MANKVDVRILRSKDSLMNSLVKIMLSQGLGEITISQLCQEAKVNRNTFYSHYSDISELFEELKGKYLESFILSFSSKAEDSSFQANLNLLLGKLKEDEDETKVILTSSNGFDFLKTLLMYIVPSTQVIKESDEMESEAISCFLLGGVCNLIYDWVVKGFPVSSSAVEKKIIVFIEKFI